MFKIDVFWIMLLFFFVFPMAKQWMLERSRVSAIRNLEKKRGSRLITLIHRQDSAGFLGMFTRNFINIEDSEQVLRAIRLTSSDTPIDLIVHTPGGLLLAASQIAAALNKHEAKVTVFVPHYAMSGGTLIALAADEIVMDRHAVLGPVDPQIGQYPAVSILKTVEEKPIAEIDDETLILADISRKAIEQTRKFVVNLLVDNVPREEAERLAQILTEGRWTHDYPISSEEAAELGLFVTTDMPTEICEVMGLYPQAGQRRPSVQYVPMPYQGNPGKSSGSGSIQHGRNF
ncbi:MAG TPA: ATP-dependent Clp protease proteolytic subunit [Thermovirgaceae bacterium]|nr:ATP-dependent Clp protease proteolytic subunit [Thermovirgaceae bacterium]